MNTKQIVIIFVIIFIISFNGASRSYVNQNIQFSNEILYVGGGPGNYSFIQDAINNATDGDTVFVYKGIYQENIIINHSILLLGECKENTVIDGKNQWNTISVEYDNVKINEFTIMNGNSSSGILDWFLAGIRITANHTTISNNIITNNRIGIFIKNSQNISLINNILINDCVVIAPYDLDAFYTPFIKDYYIHNIENNTVNGQPLYYFHQLTNTVLPSDAGQFILVSCHNNTIMNTHFSHADFAIILINSNNNTITNNTITNGSAGLLWLLYSTNNFLINNSISNNLQGICLDQASTHNFITYNTFNNNSHCNLMIESKSHNNIVRNNNFLGSAHAQAYLLNCFRTTFQNNYWHDHNSALPKLIRGELTFSFLPIFRFPWFGFDLKPSQHQNMQ
jgi:parallel beta-helix repeat protein